MKRVTGIGGIFFKAKDAPSLQAWYKRHLGIDVQVWGGAAFDWTDAEGKPVAGTTAWSIDPQESDHFAPSSAPFMVNYRVEDLHALVKVLKEEGCNVLEKIDESEYGKFAWETRSSSGSRLKANEQTRCSRQAPDQHEHRTTAAP
jgi:predicted enzyme related to lactoylglutathione lyase